MNVSKTKQRKSGPEFEMIEVIFHNLEARFGISLVLRSNLKSNNAPLRNLTSILSMKCGYISDISTLKQIISEKLRKYERNMSVLSKEK